uniref:Leucine carboxyl methyltransferase 1 homolog n=1 Tax=Tetraselmis chuii TaxID=63592 RepID=A0A7S1SVC4_9CHLO|mmetsp:Transcript_30334/g.54282  ORF Transcript_30334/g.54282 Transcript_30334/m.54282 type:complete len:250 (+) Transcript_30334:330-1079(+)
MLQSAGLAPHRYYEIDFPVVTKTKASIISQTPSMLSLVGDNPTIDTEAGKVSSDRYCLMAADLRDIGAFEAALRENQFDPGLPTLILSECVLVYMEPKYSQELVNWAGRTIPTAVFTVYEQIHPEDAFGQQMLINLESRGCPLKGIEATPTLEAHKERFLRAGWDRAEAFSMDHIYRDFLDKSDLRRIERLEIFDEFEEWHMIQEHYCITYGINDAQGLLKDFGFKSSSVRRMVQGLGSAPAGGLPNAD